MKHFFKLASIAMATGSVYATTPFHEEVKVIHDLLAADAPILNDILEARATIWNDTGAFVNTGFTSADSSNNYVSGDDFAEVKEMGMGGNIFRGVALNADGTVLVQFASSDDFTSDAGGAYTNNSGSVSLSSAYNKRLRGHYVVFHPIHHNYANGTISTISDTSNHQMIKIDAWVCETYTEDATSYSGISDRDYLMFKAQDFLETDDGLGKKFVSFANELPAPFNKCVSADNNAM